jgi:hypothetical protein
MNVQYPRTIAHCAPVSVSNNIIPLSLSLSLAHENENQENNVVFSHKIQTRFAIINHMPYVGAYIYAWGMANGNLARAPHVALVMSEANCIDPWQIGGSRRRPVTATCGGDGDGSRSRED